MFGVVLYILYRQISRVDKETWSSFSLKNPISLVGMILLVVPNLGIELMKWKLTLKTLSISYENTTVIQSFFAGIVTGMVTPNMLGNFIGRFYYFQRRNRVQIILLTLLSNFAQYLASLTFGLIAVVSLGGLLILEDQTFIVSGIAIALFLSIVLFFYFERILGVIKKRQYAQRLKDNLKKNSKYRWKLLGLSILRFLVFTSQFTLLMHAFGEEITLELVLAIWQLYLLTLIAPSLFLGKIGVKESIAIVVLGSIGVNEFSILFASLTVWLVNNISPALFGLIITKKKKNV